VHTLLGRSIGVPEVVPAELSNREAAPVAHGDTLANKTLNWQGRSLASKQRASRLRAVARFCSIRSTQALAVSGFDNATRAKNI